MQLDVPLKRVAEIDLAPLERIVLRLRPLFGAPDAPVWSIVAARSEWIGKEERPADVGFRKMRPTAYVQLCVVNDESPLSPWALSIPEDVWPRAEQEAFAREQAELCRRLYGDGLLCFAGFAILGPGGLIPVHRDMPHDPNKKAFSHHLHAPITEAEACEFVLGEAKTMLERGGLYEIDNMRPHSATHRGSGYRVNLMLDFCPAQNLEKRAG
jgi:hypothetical protein